MARAVVPELAAGRQRGLNLPVLERLPWVIATERISPAGMLLAWELGEGESASLSLAVERPGAWLILDDRLARQAAASLTDPADDPAAGGGGSLTRNSDPGAIGTGAKGGSWR